MVTGFVKPGASLEHIINTVKHETQKLSKDNHLIFWAEGNNISRTPTSKSLNRICRYLQDKQHTSVTVTVIAINVPQRFDLNVARDVNREMKNFDRKLSKLATKFKLSADISRNYFT
jgi:hypothetical protein